MPKLQLPEAVRGFVPSSGSPGKCQDATEDHVVGKQNGGDLTVALEDGTVGEQHETKPEARTALF